MTKRLLYQASIYVHDNDFDELRMKAIRYLQEADRNTLSHSRLLKRMHIDSDSFRRIVETLLESEMICIKKGERGGAIYVLITPN